MGLFKNIFNYSVGRSLSKSNPNLAGIGFMMANAYFDEKKANEKDFQKRKEQALKSYKKLYLDNMQYFGDEFLKKIYEYQNLYEELNTSNYDIIKPKIVNFISEMEFHIEATNGSYEIIKTLESFPKEDLKPGFLDNCKEKYKKIRDSIVPTLTFRYWDEYMNYLIDNNVNIENYKDVKKKLEDRIRK